MSLIATVDIGNTRTKVVILNAAGVIVSAHIDPNLKELFSKLEIKKCIYSSVRNHENGGVNEGQMAVLQEICAVEFGPELCGSLSIGVQRVETLGRDRLAGVMGAKFLRFAENCLVIDAGTCLTYDYLHEDGFYGGGAITLGMEMRYRALNEFTQKLPRLSGVEDLAEIMISEDVGDWTNAAIHSGVMGGIFDELGARTDRFRSKFANSAIILTGGDAQFLVKHIKNEIFVEPHLVHYGLYYALHSV